MKIVSQPTPATLDTIELSVVMPCLNEEKTIGSCISKATDAMARLGIKGEVIIADNGSTDRSVEIALSLGAGVIHQTAKGYGNALMAGCEAARGRFLLMGDADDSYDFSDIGPFVDKLREGYELVIGTRIKGKILPGAMPWKNRYVGNPALTATLNLLFHASTSDAHSGMRGFTADAYRRMRLRTPGMEFASEMIIKAAKLGLRMTEVPITFYPDQRDRPPHLRPWRDGWRHLKFMLMFSPSVIFLIPGIGLLAIGLLLMLSQLLAPADAPLRSFGFQMDFHWAILGSLFTLVGYQVVSTHFQAKIYSVTHRFQEEDPFLREGFRILTLERVLLFGLIVAFLGLAMDVNLLLEWIRNQQGLFVSGQTRQAVFGSTLLALGIQTMLNAFFFSILGDAYKYGYHGDTEPQKSGRE